MKQLTYTKINFLVKDKCFFSLEFDFFGNQITGWNSSEKKLFLKKNNYVKEINMHFKNYLGQGKYYFKIGIVKDTKFQTKNDIVFLENRVGTFFSKRKLSKDFNYFFETDAKIKVNYEKQRSYNL